MADIRDLFNPENESTSSKDYSIMRRAVDDSSGDLLGGIGKLFGGAVEAVDTAIQSQAQRDVYREKDQADMEFGIVGASATEASAFLPEPEDFGRSKENLARYREAVRQGKLDPAAYELRADSIMRQLRVKYPGYREQIDRMVQSEFGFDPANAVRRQLEAEFDAESRNADEALKQYRTEFNKMANSNYLVWNEDTMKLQQQVLQGNVDPNLFAKVQYQTSQARSAWTNIETQKKIRDATKEQYGDTLRNAVHQEFTDRLRMTLPEQYGGSLEAYANSLKADGFTKEEQATVAALIQNMETSIRQSIDEQYSRPIFDDNGNPTNKTWAERFPDRERLYEVLDKKIGRLKEFAFGKRDVSLAGMVDLDNEAIKASMENRMLNDPLVVEMMVEQKVLGNAFTVGGRFAQLNERSKVIAHNLTVKNAVQDQTPGETIYLAAKEAQANAKPISTKEIFEAVEGITTGEYLKEVTDKAKHINGLLDTRYNILAPLHHSDRLNLFKKMMNPEFIRMVKENGDAETEKQLPKFLSDSFRLVFREQVGNVSQLSQQDATGWQLSFDPKTGFALQREGSAAGGNLAMLSTFGSLRDGIAEVNAFMRTYNSALSGSMSEKQRAEETMRMLEETMNISTSPDAGGGFWYKAYQGIQNWLSGDKSSTDAGEVTVEPTAATGVDMIAESLDPFEGNGNYDTLFSNSQKEFGVNVSEMTIDEALQFANGEYGEWSKKKLGKKATPMGRYQIVGTTLEGLKQELGLTGTEKFDKEMQDRMFVTLLRRRGLDEYLNYQIDEKEFIRRAKQEWEGLKSRKAQKEFLKAVNEVRGA